MDGHVDWKKTPITDAVASDFGDLPGLVGLHAEIEHKKASTGGGVDKASTSEDNLTQSR